MSRHESGDDDRARGRALRALLDDPIGLDRRAGAQAIADALAARAERLMSTAARLRALSDAGRLSRPYASVSRELVHMHYNRLVGTQPPSESRVLGLLREPA